MQIQNPNMQEFEIHMQIQIRKSLVEQSRQLALNWPAISSVCVPFFRRSVWDGEIIINGSLIVI
eukprot:12933097-Prorocentrum_lima.AAC.1